MNNSAKQLENNSALGTDRGELKAKLGATGETGFTLRRRSVLAASTAVLALAATLGLAVPSASVASSNGRWTVRPQHGQWNARPQHGGWEVRLASAPVARPHRHVI